MERKTKGKKITDEQLVEIRSRRKSGESLKSIAKDFSVSHQAIIYRCLSPEARLLVQKRGYSQRNKEELTKWNKKYNLEKKDYKRRIHKVYREELKLETFGAYGKCCHCCGESRKEFLCLDHTNDDGSKHRKELLEQYPKKQGMLGDKLYRYLKKNNFPQNLGIKVACFNCNCSRQYSGYCPHNPKLTKKTVIHLTPKA